MGDDNFDLNPAQIDVDLYVERSIDFFVNYFKGQDMSSRIHPALLKVFKGRESLLQIQGDDVDAPHFGPLISVEPELSTAADRKNIQTTVNPNDGYATVRLRFVLKRKYSTVRANINWALLGFKAVILGLSTNEAVLEASSPSQQEMLKLTEECFVKLFTVDDVDSVVKNYMLRDLARVVHPCCLINYIRCATTFLGANFPFTKEAALEIYRGGKASTEKATPFDKQMVEGVMTLPKGSIKWVIKWTGYALSGFTFHPDPSLPDDKLSLPSAPKKFYADLAIQFFNRLGAGSFDWCRSVCIPQVQAKMTDELMASIQTEANANGTFTVEPSPELPDEIVVENDRFKFPVLLHSKAKAGAVIPAVIEFHYTGLQAKVFGFFVGRT